METSKKDCVKTSNGKLTLPELEAEEAAFLAAAGAKGSDALGSKPFSGDKQASRFFAICGQSPAVVNSCGGE